MLNATFARVSEEDLPRLRSWLAGLDARRDELAESYRREGTRHELFFKSLVMDIAENESDVELVFDSARVLGPPPA